jgi:hypothetical protein
MPSLSLPGHMLLHSLQACFPVRQLYILYVMTLWWHTCFAWPFSQSGSPLHVLCGLQTVLSCVLIWQHPCLL